MKATATALVALGFVVGMAADAGASAQKKKYKGRVTHHAAYSDAKKLESYRGGAYFERLPDKIPFGSALWWQVWNEVNYPW